MANETNNAIILGSNPGLRDTVKAQLRALGFNILKSTASGEAVIEELSYEDSSCSIIFSEVNLDDISCQKFLQNLRTMPEFDRTMVILIYSEDELEKLEVCLELGVGGLVKKPFNSDNFKELLQIPYRQLKGLNGNFKALFLTTLAHFSEVRSRFKTAIKFHLDILKLVQSASTYFDLGRLYIQTKNLALAQESFKKAEEIDPEYKTRIGKVLELYKVSFQAAAVDGIAKSAIKLFSQPLNLFSNSFYNSHLIRKAIIIGGAHSERLSIKNSLTNLGVKQVSLQEDPLQALKVLRDSDIDLVITWLKFSESDAANLSEVLRSIYNHHELKIMVLVTEPQIPLLRQVIERGADGYFVMPFTAERFCQRLHSCMILQDFCALSGAAESFARSSYILFESEQYAKGSLAAQQGLLRNANDPACKLFRAMCEHMLGKRELAFPLYEELARDAKELAELCTLTLKRLEAIAPKPKKKISLQQTKSAEAEVFEEPELGSQESEDSSSTMKSSAAPVVRKKKKVSPRQDGPLLETNLEVEISLGAGKIKEADSSDQSDEAELISKGPHAQKALAQEDSSIDKPVDADAPVSGEPKRVKKRIKFDERPEFLGSFSSMEDLQKEIFGKVDKGLTQGSIPDALLDLGVSESNLLLPLGVEQVFGLTPQSPTPISGPGRIIQLEDRVVTWMPTDHIKSLKFKVLDPSPKGQALAADIPKNISKLTGQAQLLNSRVLCLPDGYEESKNLVDYLRVLGKVVTQNDFIAELKLDNRMDSATQKLIQGAKEDAGNDQKSLDLGRAIVMGGYADDLFAKLTNIDESDPERSDHDGVLNYAAIAESIDKLKEPIIRFHRECLEGKKEFENSLPYTMEAFANGNTDFQMLYRAMARDHNSLESFKKIYTELSKAGNEVALEKFFKEKHKDYLKNRKSRRSLNRFLLAMGDKRRARIVAIKSIKEDKGDPDSLKAMALICFQEGDHKNAILCCEKIIMQKVYLEYAYNLLGIIYKKMNRLGDAIENYRKGIEAEPESIKLHHNIAIAYALNNESNKSKRALERSKKLKKLQGF